MKKIIIANLCLLLSIYVAPAAELCTASSITNFSYESSGISCQYARLDTAKAVFSVSRRVIGAQYGEAPEDKQDRSWAMWMRPQLSQQHCLPRPHHIQSLPGFNRA